MTIKAIKEAYKNYNLSAGERNSFVTWDYKDGNGKVVIVVNINSSKYVGDYVMQVVRVSDGKELLADGRCRPCDNLDDAIDVACEMLNDNDDYVKEPTDISWLDDMVIGKPEEEPEETEIVKANGNEVNEYTFRLVDGDFFEGETVTVETVLDGKRYTRKVKNDSWDLYVTIKGGKAYWESDRVAEPMPEPERAETFADYEEFFYLNTHMTREEARKVARQYWNDGLEKREALKKYEAQKREALNIIYRDAEGSYFLGLLWRDKYTYNEVCELVRQYNAKYAGDNPRNSDYVVIGETVGEDGVVNGFAVNGREYLYKY